MTAGRALMRAARDAFLLLALLVAVASATLDISLEDD